LTKSVGQIHTEFTEAVSEFSKIDYDIMNIASVKFDQDFYNFRSRVKELERRLGSILTQGFDDADTIFGRFKLLDSFENLLNRPIIQDELEKKHVVLLEAFKNDLKICQSIYLDGKSLIDSNSNSSPIPKNFPPISGAIYWARGLLDRSESIMSKISTLGTSCLEREE